MDDNTRQQYLWLLYGPGMVRRYACRPDKYSYKWYSSLYELMVNPNPYTYEEQQVIGL